MRTILQAVYDYRALSLKGKPMTDQQRNARLAALKEQLAYMDNALSSVPVAMIGENGFDMPETKLQETLTTGDFPIAIGEFVNRMLWAGYTQKLFNFEPLVKKDTVTNFMPHTRYQNRSQFDDLEWIGDKGPIRAGNLSDAHKNQWRVEVWGKGMDISWRTLKNDDLGYLSESIKFFGRSARRSKEKFVSRMMTNATTTSRLIALGALYSTTGRLNAARIDTAISAFNQRTDDRGEPINARMKYLVYHTALDGTLWQIRNTTDGEPGSANYGANRALRDTWVPIENPYLTGTSPNLPWYAFSDPNMDGITALVLAQLQGMTDPLILRKKSDVEAVQSLVGPGVDLGSMVGDFFTGNLHYAILDIYGTFIDATAGNLVDEKGAYYSSGTVA